MMDFTANGPERLYYQEEYVKRFTAKVLSCEETSKGYKVILDRTAFYPEGGGQPADHGTLGGAKVLDVHESLITQNADQIALKVSTATYDAEKGLWDDPVYPAANYSRSIDHIFATGALTPGRFDVVTDLYTILSGDHCPLIFDFSIN